MLLPLHLVSFASWLLKEETTYEPAEDIGRKRAEVLPRLAPAISFGDGTPVLTSDHESCMAQQAHNAASEDHS
eukprot:CAMPEP_0170596954 /NCGR_PEP_ID=MMETSP0224-20130122/15427_1 /TAXON_ID=285029 /ORGANISM="Togula jolla, Strain CCCM 725" /LENGTH=72 /DNA_ID=CAMNT_0010921349 /DNA_START=355 /DNA_END=573 /DNA_ORIENTATION=+